MNTKYNLEKIKSNKGSSLIMVLFIVTLMSTFGVAVLLFTLSDYKMSIVRSDENKAYFVTEAGLEQVASDIDENVSIIQEEARKVASSAIQEAMSDPEGYVDSSYYPEKIFSQAGTAPDITYYVDEVKVKAAFNAIYKGEFNARVDDFYKNNTENVSKEYVVGKILYETDVNKLTCKVVTSRYTADSNDLSLTVEGSKNEKLKKTITATFRLRDNPKEGASRYNITNPKKAVVNTPSVLKDKALVAGMNVVSASGSNPTTDMVTIKGDVLCFGTIPNESNQEKQDATWQYYGGVMAGVPAVADVENKDYFGFDITNVANTSVENSSGIFDIKGNVSTLSYVHTLNNLSKIIVGEASDKKDVYARAINIEETANGSDITINGGSYFLDAIHLDSDNSNLTVNGDAVGFVEEYDNINGTDASTPEDSFKFKRSSNMVVNGTDSKLNLNGSIFIGGSTFVQDYYNNSAQHYYMTGLSALKSSSKVINTFRKDDLLNPDNYLYYFITDTDGKIVQKKAQVNDSFYNNTKIFNQTYKNLNDNNNVELIEPVEMPSGATCGAFDSRARAYHFKSLWDNIKSDGLFDALYSTYLDTNSIKITKITSGKIDGYSYGNIIGTKSTVEGDTSGIISPEDGFTLVDDDFYNKRVIESANYFNKIKDFLTDTYSEGSPKLDYVTPQKYFNFTTSTDIIDLSYAGFVCSKEGTIEISYNSDGYINVNGQKIKNQGIIYATDNIIINDGVTFKGALITKKNIIFKGAANITYDQNVIDSLLSYSSPADGDKGYQIRTVFGVAEGTKNPDQSIQVQKISTKQNIDLMDWKRQ